MGTESSVSAVKRFMNDCAAKDGTKIITAIDVFENGEMIHTGKGEVYCSYNHGYMQYSVSILWSFDDYVMRKLGLHGTYNTNYQSFSYSDGLLVVEDDDLKICISKDR